MHLCFGGIEGRLVGPHLPREDNLLTVLRIDGAAEVRIFATGDVILPRLDDLDASIFPKDYSPVLGPFAIGLHLFRGYGNHESCNVHDSGSLHAWMIFGTITQGGEVARPVLSCSRTSSWQSLSLYPLAPDPG